MTPFLCEAVILDNLIYTSVHFVTNSDVHGYSTRPNQHFHILPTAVNVATRNIAHQPLVWYNTLSTLCKKSSHNMYLFCYVLF